MIKTFVLAAALVGSLFANSTVLATEKKGFWWYEDPVPEAEERESKYELPPLPAPQELAKLHPEEIEAVMEERLEYAIWKKTPEAVQDYYIVQDVARRNAVAFTALTKFVMLNEPELNVRAQYPITNAGRKVATQLHDSTVTRSLASARDDYALVMFSTESCPYCPTQYATLKMFADKHQWSVQAIDIDRNPVAQARFDVKVTPMTMLIERGSERWLPIAVGVESLPVLEDNAYRAIRMLRGEITPQQFILTEYNDGGFFDPIIGEDDASK